MKYAIVENKKVTNIVEWDGKSDWRPESGEVIAIGEKVVSIGYIYENGEFIATPETEADSL